MALHSTGAESPVSGQKLPCGHATVTDALALGQYAPTGQGAVADIPVTEQYPPTAHPVGVRDPSGQKFETVHTSAAADRPVVGQ